MLSRASAALQNMNLFKEITGWSAVKFGKAIPVPRRMNPVDFDDHMTSSAAPPLH